MARKKAPKVSLEDPVIRQYKIYLNRPRNRLMVFQYPNRDSVQPYSAANGQQPSEIRVKPKHGLVEVDVSINVHANFDKAKGIQYGKVMRKNEILREGGSYGMAGGLGLVGLPRPPREDGQVFRRDQLSEATLLQDFEDANNKGHVMNKITLGGQIAPPQSGDPVYFIGVFRGDELHLNKVDVIVQLRPQFHHLDALHDQEKSLSRAQRELENPPPESEARAVNMTVKSSDSDEFDVNEMTRTLKGMQEEPWQHLKWVDQEDEHSYRVFDEQLFLKDTGEAQTLVSSMTNEQYLDAISAPRVDPTRQGSKVMTRPDRDSEQSSSEDSDVSNDKDH